MYVTVKRQAKISDRRVPITPQFVQYYCMYLYVRESVFGEKLRPDSPAFLGLKYQSRLNPGVLTTKIAQAGEAVGIHKKGGPLYERFGPHCGRTFGTYWLEMSGLKSIFIMVSRGDQCENRSMDSYIRGSVPTHVLVEQFLKYVPMFDIGGPLDF